MAHVGKNKLRKEGKMVENIAVDCALISKCNDIVMGGGAADTNISLNFNISEVLL